MAKKDFTFVAIFCTDGVEYGVRHDTPEDAEKFFESVAACIDAGKSIRLTNPDNPCIINPAQVIHVKLGTKIKRIGWPAEVSNG